MAVKTKSAITTRQARALHAQIGAAVVTWSQVENFWAMIFRDLMFHRIGDKPGRDAETNSRIEPADVDEKTVRADAVYFALGTAEAQRKTIESVAKIALKNRQQELATLRTLIKETRTLAQVRNEIIHAYYDQWYALKGSTLVLQPLTTKAKSALQPKKNVDLVKAAAEFKALSHRVLSLWSDITEGE